MALNIDQVIERRPSWVSREISADEAKIIANEIEKNSLVRGLEIGSASGFSASCIYSQLYYNDPNKAVLDCYDLSEKCYYDDSHTTGDAVWEIHGKTANVNFTLGVTSADVTLPKGKFEPYDFLFIDANHRNPWAAFDLLSLGRFLRPGALIALDDVNMMYHPKFRDCNGSRDLYRCWRGPKWRYKGLSNIGFFRKDSDDKLVSSIVSCLSNDWDLAIEDSVLDKFVEIAGHYGSDAGRAIKDVIQLNKSTSRFFVHPPHKNGD